MTDKPNDGGPRCMDHESPVDKLGFGVTGHSREHWRYEFAGGILAGYVANPNIKERDLEVRARDAVNAADALLKELDG